MNITMDRIIALLALAVTGILLVWVALSGYPYWWLVLTISLFSYYLGDSMRKIMEANKKK